MLSLPAFAYVSEFSEYQFDKSNVGWKGGEVGSWSAFSYESSATASSPGNMRPLIWDLNNDGVNELIYQDGNALTIAKAVSGSIFIIDSLNMNGTNNVSDTIALDSDNNGLSEIFGIWNSTLYLIEYNTSLDIKWSQILTKTIRTSPRCINYSGLSACYWISYNGSATFLSEAGLAGHAVTDYLLASGNQVGYYDHTKFSPPIAALNKNPSAPQMVIPWDQNGNLNEGVAVVDIVTTSLWTVFNTVGYKDNLMPDNTFSLSGRIDGITVNSAQSATKYSTQTCYAGCDSDYPNKWDPRGPLCRVVCGFYRDSGVYGGGYPQIYISESGDPLNHGVSSLGASAIIALSYSGSAITNYPKFTYSTYSVNVADNQPSDIYSSDIMWGHFVGSDAWQYCQWSFDVQVAYLKTALSCYLYNTTKLFSTEWNGYSTYIMSPTCGEFTEDIDNDGYDEIVTGTGYLNINSLTNYTFIPFGNSLSTAYHAVASDMNNDDNPEVCGTGGTIAFCAYSTFTNQPPVLNASYHTNFNTLAPICIGTYLTFSAYECASSGPVAGCSYTNDNPYDQERIISTCGRTDGYTYGVYSGGNPSLSCYMNESGTYNFNVYIQDTFNNESLTQMQTYIITVVNSTVPGYCNLPPSSVVQSVNGTTGQATSASSASSGISQGMDVLTNGDIRVKQGIAVLIFAVVNCIIIYFSITHRSPVSAVVYVLINFILSVLLWMLSLISILIATFIVIGSLFIAALSMLFRPGGAE